jgi:hypothetical protein
VKRRTNRRKKVSETKLKSSQSSEVAVDGPRLDALAASYAKWLDDQDREQFQKTFVAARSELLEAAQKGANPSKLLFWLFVTRYSGVLNASVRLSKAALELKPSDRRVVQQGIRRLHELGRDWLRDVLERDDDAENRATRLYQDLSVLRLELADKVEVNPFFLEFVHVDRTGSRWREQAVTACLTCMMKELQGRLTKPYDFAVVLLEKFGLMRPKPGVTARELVMKRVLRAKRSKVTSRIANRIVALQEQFDRQGEQL